MSPPPSATNGELDHELAMSVLAGLTDGIVIANQHGELVYMNPAGQRLVGVGVVSGPPDTWPAEYGIFRPDGVTPVPARDVPLTRALAGEVTAEVELLIRNPAVPEGTRIAVVAAPLRDPAGSFRGAVAVFRNVNERWRTNEELKQRETYLHAILDNLPDIAWLKDRDSRFVAVNAELARASGLPQTELVGKTDLDVWPRELAERYRADDLAVMERRSTMRIEEPLALADGTVSIIETIKTAIVDERGEVIGTTGIARDITERKHAEEALRGAKQELERRIEERTRELERAQDVSVRKERLAVLGQLAGGVAHQIRNPLAAIKNATYVLERSLPLLGIALPPIDPSARRSSPALGERGPDGVLRLTPEQQAAHSLAIIHEEIRRANDIISGLLDYARIRAPVRQNVAAQTLVTQTLAAAEIPESVKVETELGEWILAVDPGQVQEALHILVRNAVDAMPEGGTLYVTCHDERGTVVLGVEDTGLGVQAGVAERLFEPLLTTKPQGLGLGLVTARTLVEAQGGNVSFVGAATRATRKRGERDRPPGARFEMRFPRS